MSLDSSARWQFLFSDTYLYFLFKDILIDCGNRSSDSGNVHTDAKAVRLRHDNGSGVYELAAAPARAVLRKVVRSSLRTLIEDLVLSNVAKYGTWKDIRLLNMPQGKAAGLHGVSAHLKNRIELWSFACVLSELCTFIVFGTAPSHDATQTHSILRRAAKSCLLYTSPSPRDS